MGIFDSTGAKVVEYTYSAWGELLSMTGTQAATVGNANPIRYRGYYYDQETGYYYLQSRYYDPETQRFLNADGYVSTGQGILSQNMFAYCENNPVNRIDPNGVFWKEIGDWFKNAWNSVKTWASNFFGAASSTVVKVKTVEKVIVPEPSPITIKTGNKVATKVYNEGDSTKPISVYQQTNFEASSVSSGAGLSAGLKLNICEFTLDINFGFESFGISGSWANGDQTDSFGVNVNLSTLSLGFDASTAKKWDANIQQISYVNMDISGRAILAAFVFFSTGERVPAPVFN